MNGKAMFLSVATLSLLLAIAPMQSRADSLQEMQNQMQQLQSQETNSSKQMEEDQSQVKNIQNSLQVYTQSVNNVQHAVDTNRQQIQSLENQIAKLNTEIAQNQKQMEDDQNELTLLVRAQYENGNTTYMDVLFQSTDFSDLLDRFNTLSLLSKHERDLVAQMKTLRDQLVKEQSDQKQAYTTLQKKQSEDESLLVQYKALQSDKQKAYNSASAKLNKDKQAHGLLESQLQLTQSQIQEIITATQNAENLMNNPTYLQNAQQGLVSVNASALISYAEQFIGTPYVWGGTSPSGFDCSGFTQYVFRHFGVYLNRTSQDQFAEGLPVSRGDLQPGDLVFFSTYAPGATHVGIYIGGGMMINSEDAGCMITSLSNPYWGPRYIGARRIIK